MTGESSGQTEAWVEKYEVQFGYAYDKKSALSRQLGIRGIPHAVLVDPTGTITWRGHPARLDDATVKRALAGALPVPVWDWPKKLAPVTKALGKRQLGKAFTTVAKLSAEAPELSSYRDIVQEMIASTTGNLAALIDEGDFLAARDSAIRATKELAGLPEVAEVEAVLKFVRSDKNAKSVMAGQKKLAKLKASRVRKAADAHKLIALVSRLAKKYPRTIVSDQADEFVADLNQRLERLR